MSDRSPLGIPTTWVIDDSPKAQLVFSTLLKRAAGNAAIRLHTLSGLMVEIEKMLREASIHDVFLVDYRIMPQPELKDGLDICRRILSAFPGAKIVVITAYPSDARRCIEQDDKLRRKITLLRKNDSDLLPQLHRLQ